MHVQTHTHTHVVVVVVVVVIVVVLLNNIDINLDESLRLYPGYHVALCVCCV